MKFPKRMRVIDVEELGTHRLDYCQNCGKHGRWAKHHIIHRSQGRLDIPENLTELCTDCHERCHREPEAEAEIVKRCKSYEELKVLRELSPRSRLWLRIQFPIDMA